MRQRGLAETPSRDGAWDAECSDEGSIKRKMEAEERRKRRRLDKTLQSMNEQLETIVRRAWEEGKEVEVWFREAERRRTWMWSLVMYMAL